jgi:formate dehydrogenase iron-sulfur subunit
VLLLSSVPFEQFGYRADMQTEPMPLLTSRVLSKVPDVVMLGGVLLGGIWWITNRRADVDDAEGTGKLTFSAGTKPVPPGSKKRGSTE